MSAVAEQTVITASWSPLNPRSVCFNTDFVVSQASTVVRVDFPIGEQELARLAADLGDDAVLLVRELTMINYARGVLFSGSGRSFTVLGPTEAGEGSGRKRDFVTACFNALCRVYGLDPALRHTRLVYQRLTKRNI